MVELRKRPAPATATSAAAPPPPTKRRASTASVKKSKETTAKGKAESSTASPAAVAGGGGKDLAVGDIIDLDSEIGRIEVTTDDGKSVTLKTLHEQSAGGSGGSSSSSSSSSKNGIVIFTYPKASTPGCTTQAQLFRDSHNIFINNNRSTTTTTNLKIFGLSTDSPKANASFKAKHNLPYTLLCDPPGKLVRALGMGHDGSNNPSKKTARRGVVVLVSDDSGRTDDNNEDGDGDGGGGGDAVNGEDEKGNKAKGKGKRKAKLKVAVMLKGGPGTTVDAVKEFLNSSSSSSL